MVVDVDVVDVEESGDVVGDEGVTKMEKGKVATKACEITARWTERRGHTTSDRQHKQTRQTAQRPDRQGRQDRQTKQRRQTRHTDKTDKADRQAEDRQIGPHEHKPYNTSIHTSNIIFFLLK